MRGTSTHPDWHAESEDCRVDDGKSYWQSQDVGGAAWLPFGIGVGVLTDLGDAAHLGSVGSYGWDGAYGTYFRIDPKEEMIGILMVQIRPYTQINIRQDFQNLATQAIE